jgi:UDP-N-acetylmuramoyl-tripeptide--D-alanyl-D-alanine ligase
VGVVLNVGQAHVGEFGGQAAIARAKGELVDALPHDGVAVLNADDPLVWAMRSRTSGQTLGFSLVGPPRGPGVWASDLVSDDLGRFAFRLHQQHSAGAEAEVEVQLRGAGRHQVGNALAAAGAALALGLDLSQIATGLTSATARSHWRMELQNRVDGVTVINDAYNANPDSMRAAVDTLAALGQGGARRTWAVLGDMLELGDTAAEAHTALGRFVAERGIDRLVVVGEFAETLAAAARNAGLSAPGAVRVGPDKAGATQWLRAGLGPGDVVLVKASRGLALDTVADEILAFGEDLT